MMNNTLQALSLEVGWLIIGNPTYYALSFLKDLAQNGMILDPVPGCMKYSECSVVNELSKIGCHT